MRLALLLALSPSLLVDDCCDIGTTGTTDSPASTSETTADLTGTETTAIVPTTGADSTTSLDTTDATTGGVGCGPTCARDGVVFVSGKANVFQPFSLGGPDGTDNADAACQELAKAAGLVGTFKAWLSTKYVSPSMRFIPAPGRYARPDGVVVAVSWADLNDGLLLAPIRLDALGKDAEDMPVWTGTVADGDWSTESCGDWSAAGVGGTWGISAFADQRWTEYAVTDACATAFMGLYCVEQGPGKDPCDANPDAFKESAFKICEELQIDLSTCLGLITGDWCATCEKLYDYCKDSGKGADCPAALGQCLQCVYAHGSCTQQAMCGLGDGACIVPGAP